VDLYASSPSPEQFTAIIKDSFPFYADQLSGFVNEWILTPADPKYIQDSLEYINDLIKFRMDIPTVGASGAIFGILMAFGLMFPNSLLYIYFAIPIKAKYFVMLYGGLELYMGIANNPGDNVAHFAHLGGMVFGFAMMKYWNKRPRRGT
jgi:membrane associated rhomboid family serine protease